MLVPLSPSRAGCLAAVRGGNHGQWTGCDAPPAYVGTVTFPRRPREVWRGFACERHREQLDDPLPLDNDARADLASRRKQLRRALDGLPYIRTRPLDNRP